MQDGASMEKNSLSHTSWECAYHIVRIPKHGRKVPCGERRREMGETLRTLVERMDGVEMVAGGACPDHIRVCLRIAPRHSAGRVVGRPRGKSAMVLSGRRPEWRGATGRDRTLWARGYYV